MIEAKEYIVKQIYHKDHTEEEVMRFLIRCKDCRYTYTFNDGRTICTLLPERLKFNPEGYCHRGERE